MARKDYLDGIFELAAEIKELREQTPADASPEPNSPEVASPEAASPANSAPEEPSLRSRVDGYRDIRRRFVKVDVNVLDVALAELGPIAGLVYLRLYRLSYGWRQNTCRVTTQAIAEACGMSDRTVQSAVNKLIMEGYIEREVDTRKNAGGNLYRVYLPHEVPTLALKCAEGASPEESSGEGTSPEGASGEAFSRTPEGASPEGASPQSANPPLAAVRRSPEGASPEGASPIIDNSTLIDNNNIDEHPVVALLRKEGFNIHAVAVSVWIARGITIDRVRDCIEYVKKRSWTNRDGALRTAIDSDWPVTVTTKGQESKRVKQVDYEEQRRHEEDARVASRLAEMSQEDREAWQQRAEADCQRDPGYRAVPVFLRKHYVQAHLRNLLLDTR